jgi:hypothetical protein
MFSSLGLVEFVHMSVGPQNLKPPITIIIMTVTIIIKPKVFMNIITSNQKTL